MSVVEVVSSRDWLLGFLGGFDRWEWVFLLSLFLLALVFPVWWIGVVIYVHRNICFGLYCLFLVIFLLFVWYLKSVVLSQLKRPTLGKPAR
ncbi:hypothetical protein F4809DRAFT_631451 [Biscogniauxia mediterranea]|nr:hypothetical protein F4809DRAFT_631451 [Biscogniauxia mediterranea]